MIHFLLFLLLIPSLCFSDSELTVGGKTAAAHIIQSSGTSLRPRPYLNFTGSGVSCSDSGGKTVCTISGGGGGGGGISGLTTNYIPKATSDTVISNSRLLDDGTNFVFGTNNSTSALDSFTFHSTTGGITLNGPISGIGGIDGFTKVMLHLNNDIVDAALTPNTFTNNGSIAFTNTSPPFSGKYWAVFDGGGTKSLSTPANTAFDLGSSVWTIDFVVKWNTHLATGAFLGQSSGANDYWWVAWSFGSTRLFFQHVAGGIVTGQFHSASFTPVNGTQYHIAFERTGANTGMIFINGVSQAVTIDTTLSTIAHETGNLTLGTNSSFANDPDANIAEVRFSPGVVRWSSDFTPPATEYTNSALAMPFAFAVNSSTIAQIIGSSIDGTLKFKNNGVTAQTIDSSGGTAFGGNITTSTHNIVTDTTTGTSFGSGTTQKTSAYGVTPVVQGLATTDLGTILSNWGLRASGTAYPITTSGTKNFGDLTTSQAVFTDGSNNLVSNAISGSGNVAMTTSPIFTTPSLGVATATSVTMTGNVCNSTGCTTNSGTSGYSTNSVFSNSGNTTGNAFSSVNASFTSGSAYNASTSSNSFTGNLFKGTYSGTSSGNVFNGNISNASASGDTFKADNAGTGNAINVNTGTVLLTPLTATTPLALDSNKKIISGSYSGNTTQVATVTGSKTSGSLTKFDASGNVVTAALIPGTLTDGKVCTYTAAGTSLDCNTTASGTGTVTNTGGSLTSNSVVLGAGTNDTKVVAGMTTDGVSQLNLGVNTTTLGKVKLFGNTSGDATIQPAAVAGTATVVTLPNASSTLPIFGQQITFSGPSAARTVTFPDASFTAARTDAANTFTGHQTIEGVTSTGATGTGKFVFDGSPTLVTPTIGAAVGTSLTLSSPGTSSTDVANLSSTNTYTNKTMSYAVASGAGTYKGNIITFTSAETQAIGDAVQIDGSGNAHLAKADTIGHASVVLLAAAAVSGSASNTYLLPGGTLKLSSSPSWTVGGLVYLSTTGTTGNTLTQTAPSGTSNSIQILGVAVAADTLLFMPSLSQVEHT